MIFDTICSFYDDINRSTKEYGLREYGVELGWESLDHLVY